MAESGCGCGCGGGLVELAPATKVGTLTTDLTWRDVVGGWKARWGFGRMRYAVAPGLYRVGEPDADSPVLVTANYKLTVDALRRRLGGLNVWVLVLDTKGVNVWCAAGKGTFGTAELVRRIEATGLKNVVKHRKLILPQLGATGVAAHKVKAATGFSVHWGPVRARDIRAYLSAGMKATSEMRRVEFGWKDRIVLAPNELTQSWKWSLGIVAALVAFHLWRPSGSLGAALAPFAAALLTGGVLVPLLLPWLPGKPFAVKGSLAGGAAAAAALALWRPAGTLEGAGTALAMLAITSYMAMVFTGSSTYTCLAGVKKEVRVALPAILVAGGLGAAARLAAALV